MSGEALLELVEKIARALVDHPEEVRVAAVEGTGVTVFELRTHPSDLGKVIGRQGRIVMAMRVVLGAIGVKLHRRLRLEIIGEDSEAKAAGAE
jgi:uncharacterized protein